MSEEVQAVDSSLGEQLAKEIKQDVMDSCIKEIKAQFKGKAPAVAKSEDDGSFGEWLSLVGKTVSHGRDREAAFNTLANKYNVKAMNQGTTTEGGFLVPYQFVNELMSVQGYDGVTYPSGCRQFNVTSNSLVIPVLDQTGTPSSGTSAFVGGVAIDVVSEGSAPGAETKPAFKQRVIPMKKVLAYTQVSNELLDNSAITVEQLISDLYKRAIVNWVDYNVLVGTGFGAGTAIVGHASTIKVPRAEANKFSLVDAAKMYRRLPGSSRARARWIIHPYILSEMVALADANGNSVWLPNQNATNGFNLSLFGIPVYTTEYAPALGQEGDVMLVDLEHYILGINKNIEIKASHDFAFTSDVVTYRLAFRAGGNSILTASVKLADGTSTVSPFVVLDDSVS